jgi:hypothetical protein
MRERGRKRERDREREMKVEQMRELSLLYCECLEDGLVKIAMG